MLNPNANAVLHMQQPSLVLQLPLQQLPPGQQVESTSQLTPQYRPQNPDGTKGVYAGNQSLITSPEGTQTVAAYMEREGGMVTERILLNQLHFNLTN